MKIAHLDTGRSWRGGQAQVRLLMRGLRERSCENLLLAPQGPLADRTRAEGFATMTWNVHGEWDPIALLDAGRMLARESVDVAHCHTAHAHAVGVPAARLARVPAIVVSRRVDFAVARHPLSALKYRVGVDRYLCISRGVMRVLADAGIPESKLALVPSGIELPCGETTENAIDLRASIGAPPTARIVGTVAALAPHKNHRDLLAAASIVTARLDDVQFVWIGEGELHERLIRERHDRGLDARVHLLGFRSDARDLMRQFTVFALSSYLEGLCTSILDAQARSVPVVATAVGGVPDLIEDGVSGRLVPERDPERLAAALIEALDRAELRREWAERAALQVRAFGADRMVERTLEEYRRILGEED